MVGSHKNLEKRSAGVSVRGSGCSRVLGLVLCLCRERTIESRMPINGFCHCFDIAVKIVYLSNLPKAEELFGSLKILMCEGLSGTDFRRGRYRGLAGLRHKV